MGIEGLTKSRPCGRIKDTRITNCRHLGEGIGPLPQAVRMSQHPVQQSNSAPSIIIPVQIRFSNRAGKIAVFALMKNQAV